MVDAFGGEYEVSVFPTPVNAVTLVDGVSNRAEEIAHELGMTVHDLRKVRGIERKSDVLQEALNQTGTLRSAAWLGRGGMDDFLKKGGVDAFWQLRDSGVQVVGRLGNGVGMDVQAAFDSGVLVARTPRGNAEAVRIWQDLILHALFANDVDLMINPALKDSNNFKHASDTNKLTWDRKDLAAEVNPDSCDELPEKAKAMAEYLRGKKVTILGAGRIGREVIAKSPFLREADIHVFDPYPPKDIANITVHNSSKDALADAELVLLHMSGADRMIGAEELKLVKDGAKICNMARGGIVDPKALFEAIESGKISGAGLDTHLVEGDDTAQYVHLPSSRVDWSDEHYAVALRRHSKVIGTNHSAASDEKAQAINAEDGIRAIHHYNRFGELQDGVLVPAAQFPYDAFMQERDGHLVPVEANGHPRIVIESMHDGLVPGLMDDVHRAIAAKLGWAKLNVVGGKISPYEYRQGDERRRNAIALQAVEVPARFGQMSPAEMQRSFGELIRLVESERGMRKARILFPRRKNT